MGRSKNGQAVPPHRLTEAELSKQATEEGVNVLGVGGASLG